MGETEKKLKEEEIARIVKQVEAELRKELHDTPGTLDEIEDEAQKIGERVKAIIERQRLQSKGHGFTGQHALCRCGHQARLRSEHVRRVTTQSGVRRITRSYYYCDSCRTGFCPLDDQLGLVAGEFSVRVRGLASRFAGYVPYESASQELREVLGVHISASSIRRIAMASGKQLQIDFAVNQARLQRYECDFSSDRHPKQLHVSMDGCMVMVNGQWQEVKTAVVYQRRNGKEHEIACADYYSSLAESSVFGQRMRTQAFLSGADHCRDVAMLGDGAKWIWQETAKNLPRAVQILDLYHVMDYVWEIANARWGENTQPASAWADEQKNLLLDDRVEDVIGSMRTWDPSSDEHGELKRTTLGYFESNKGRMLYKTFLAQGWHIGSGVMEAANKAVVQQRMKRSGMRWEEQGAEAILHLRAAIVSSRKLDYRDLARRAATFAYS